MSRPLSIVALALAAACAAAAAASGRANAVRIAVDRPLAPADTPLRIRVTGLEARERATVVAATSDASGRPWTSRAVFVATRRGAVDLATAAPLAGSYRGAAAMGLFWSLLPPHAGATEPFVPAGDTEDVLLSVVARGRTLATQHVVRELVPAGVTRADVRPDANGFYGELYRPATVPASPRPAVLLFGGSGGGNPAEPEAALLAAHGYAALALAYFGEPGLPPTLASIPLEYFATALRWLRGQPGVDPDRLVVEGISRGSEAALLLGVHYPDLVSAVVALVPSDVAICSFPDCEGPAWTLGGQPLPYTRQFDQPYPTDVPAAAIPVERIRGPIFLDCGGADQVWTSCPYAQAIVARLEAHRSPYEHVLVRYADAGHEIGFPVPYLPGRYALTEGRTPDANPRAQAATWPRLLAFLARLR